MKVLIACLICYSVVGCSTSTTTEPPPKYFFTGTWVATKDTSARLKFTENDDIVCVSTGTTNSCEVTVTPGSYGAEYHVAIHLNTGSSITDKLNVWAYKDSLINAIPGSIYPKKFVRQ